jgi:hypothetical protein
VSSWTEARAEVSEREQSAAWRIPFTFFRFGVLWTTLAPSISFVTYYRHYPDTPTSLDRIRFFAKSIQELSKQHGLASEVIVVEPEPGVLAGSLESLGARVVRYPGARFLGHLAFNVGVKHATGDYVVVSSRDSLFNSELMGFLASGKLERRTVYRVDRRDVKQLEKYPDSVSELLQYCSENTLRVNGIWDAYLPGKTWARPAVSFVMRALFFPYQVPHTNACGDFTMMHRDDWRRIRGYPQVISAGLHLDSFAVYSAIFSGVRQVILRDPMRLYHVDHPRKEPAPSQNIMQCLKMMRFAKKPLILNDESWGDDIA